MIIEINNLCYLSLNLILFLLNFVFLFLLFKKQQINNIKYFYLAASFD